MSEHWDLSPDTDRQANKITTFILFCEDEVSERIYFKNFGIDKILMVNVVPNQFSNFRNLVNVLIYCEKNGLLGEVNEQFVVLKDTTLHIWSVFDRDTNLSDPNKLDEDNMSFTTSIKNAEAAGIKVAWSNDVFELWILLHFEDVTPAVAINREQVYARLTAIFKALPDQSEEMWKITGNSKFNYKENAKREKFFTPYVKPLLAPRLQNAIERAQTLEAAFTAKHRYHEMNPCTKVHHLVNSLLSSR
jgi:hypothetical protein